MPHQPPCAILPIPVAIPRVTCATRTSTFNYYGPVQSLLTSEASKFLATITDAVEQEAASTINSFILATHNDCIGAAEEKTACWLTIRVTKPTYEFEIPRWHQDGRMFPYDEGRKEVVRSKYALTLLGPTTLMLQPNAHVFSTYHRGETQHYWWRKTHGPEPTEENKDQAYSTLRHWLADEFKDAIRVRVGDGEVVRFSWGRDDSPVHSEPDLISDRVFVTVLYGSESELREMCNWRSAEYGKFDW
ncbi:hypothetical protein K458DRAFT_422513 [Lentithecium fluviatile CBS 122367]|uniref:Uncharacterized protein n=1 Tax=Lentithecium fluviatile CBS 122367 TaxID=1168545 RepID=A0A6G1ILH2_9PLEO|nr:hypothetical protein K458DRAFT_422513 [Lentithecium fluviatile CBS 122367]